MCKLFWKTEIFIPSRPTLFSKSHIFQMFPWWFPEKPRGQRNRYPKSYEKSLGVKVYFIVQLRNESALRMSKAAFDGPTCSEQRTGRFSIELCEIASSRSKNDPHRAIQICVSAEPRLLIRKGHSNEIPDSLDGRPCY
jgi:hypothetical protein